MPLRESHNDSLLTSDLTRFRRRNRNDEQEQEQGNMDGDKSRGRERRESRRQSAVDLRASSPMHRTLKDAVSKNNATAGTPGASSVFQEQPELEPVVDIVEYA
jgi:hypothetical protein